MHFSVEDFGFLNKPTYLLPHRESSLIFKCQSHVCINRENTRSGPMVTVHLRLMRVQPPLPQWPLKTVIPTGKHWWVTSIGNCSPSSL